MSHDVLLQAKTFFRQRHSAETSAVADWHFPLSGTMVNQLI